RGYEIASRQQSCDTDPRTPEPIVDSHSPEIHSELIHALFEVTVKYAARAHRAANARIRPMLLQRGRELSHERSHHADAVFNVRKVRIVAGCRQLRARHDVNLVA